MTNGKRAAVYASLYPDENQPGVDFQVRSCLRKLAKEGMYSDQSLVYCDVMGELNPERREQVTRLLQQMRRQRFRLRMSIGTKDEDDRRFLEEAATTSGLRFTVDEKFAHLKSRDWPDREE